MKKRPVGRPRKKAKDRLSESFHVKLNREEFDLIERLAAREGKTLSEFAREALRARMKNT